MSDTNDTDGGVARGESMDLGPFSFRVPDRDCRVGDCDEPADGVVRFKDGDTLNCCVECAPQFVEPDGSSWTPLAGGRPLDQSSGEHATEADHTQEGDHE